MCPGGYTIEVTSLSPKATEEDVYDFFAHCGAIQHVEIIRYCLFMFPTSGDQIQLHPSFHCHCNCSLQWQPPA
uniref:Binding partner of ACD11 1 n=1 Tax=Rhizophora mucronata TaxID=61149 RepID=A0A2P2L1H4_RHIMU